MAIQDVPKTVAWAMGMTENQQRLLVRTGWVLIVTVHILWVCGWLAWAGFASPFAAAHEVEDLKQSVNISARLALTQEIRAQIELMCSQPTLVAKKAVAGTIDKLLIEYKKIAGEPYPYPKKPCDDDG